MTEKTAAQTRRARLKRLAHYTPAVAGSLALGACLTASGDADAALIVYDVNETVMEGSSLSLDINQDTFDDVFLNVGLDESISLKVFGDLSVISPSTTPGSTVRWALLVASDSCLTASPAAIGPPSTIMVTSPSP